MKTRFLLLAALSSIAFAVEPSRPNRALVDAPFVQVQKDGSLSETMDAVAAGENTGFPAFESLTLQPVKGAAYWVLSGRIVSTNNGGGKEGAVVYAAYSGGLAVIGMANMKGDVLLSIHPSTGKDGKAMLPDAIYIGRDLVGRTPRANEFIRKYPFREYK